MQNTGTTLDTLWITGIKSIPDLQSYTDQTAVMSHIFTKTQLLCLLTFHGSYLPTSLHLYISDASVSAAPPALQFCLLQWDWAVHSKAKDSCKKRGRGTGSDPTIYENPELGLAGQGSSGKEKGISRRLYRVGIVKWRWGGGGVCCPVSSLAKMKKEKKRHTKESYREPSAEGLRLALIPDLPAGMWLAFVINFSRAFSRQRA